MIQIDCQMKRKITQSISLTDFYLSSGKFSTLLQFLIISSSFIRIHFRIYPNRKYHAWCCLLSNQYFFAAWFHYKARKLKFSLRFSIIVRLIILKKPVLYHIMYGKFQCCSSRQVCDFFSWFVDVIVIYLFYSAEMWYDSNKLWSAQTIKNKSTNVQ